MLLMLIFTHGPTKCVYNASLPNNVLLNLLSFITRVIHKIDITITIAIAIAQVSCVMFDVFYD